MKILKIAVALVILAAAFCVGFFARDLRDGAKPNIGALRRISGTEPQPAIPPSQVFEDNFRTILAHHKSQVTAEDLRNAAMSGLVASLGDPHTNFLEPKVNQAFTTETKGNYSGIGARLSEDPLGARIAIVFRDGPADRAGLRPGDVITKVDDYTASGRPVDEIVSHILGDEGTPVQLSIIREGVPDIRPMRIVRRQISIPTVENKMIANRLAYISVSGFSQPTAQQFRDALIESVKQNPSGLIIDMRGNPGGLVDVAVEMLSLFISDKPVVTMKPRDRRPVTAKTRQGEVLVGKMPIAILVNEDSASAAEIFSGVMRDYQLATLIGTHTYGKASVQQLFDLPAGASAKITIARYFLPSTGDIARKVDDDGVYISGGLAPDIKVELKPGQSYTFGEPGKDPQLDKAIAFLTGGA